MHFDLLNLIHLDSYERNFAKHTQVWFLIPPDLLSGEKMSESRIWKQYSQCHGFQLKQSVRLPFWCSHVLLLWAVKHWPRKKQLHCTGVWNYPKAYLVEELSLFIVITKVIAVIVQSLNRPEIVWPKSELCFSFLYIYFCNRFVVFFNIF